MVTKDDAKGDKVRKQCAEKLLLELARGNRNKVGQYLQMAIMYYNANRRLGLTVHKTINQLPMLRSGFVPYYRAIEQFHRQAMAWRENRGALRLEGKFGIYQF